MSPRSGTNHSFVGAAETAAPLILVDNFKS